LKGMGMSTKLNIGGTQTIERFPTGWVNCDIAMPCDVYVDIGVGRLPFEFNSVDAIYCSHVLEHIWPERLAHTFSEFYRILRMGASIRIVVPDMDAALEAYHNGDYKYLDNTKMMACPTIPDHPLFHLMSWWWCYNIAEEGIHYHHVCGFNYDVLHMLLKATGFHSITRMEYGKHANIFEGCDNPDGHADTSVYVEARK
jgi:predicted SAM-dependent methyltransferase